MCPAYYSERVADAGAGAETERGIDLLNRDIGLAGPTPEDATNVPATREARVERHRAVSQPHHRADVLAEEGERNGSIGKHARIVSAELQTPVCVTAPFAPVRLSLL